MPELNKRPSSGYCIGYHESHLVLPLLYSTRNPGIIPSDDQAGEALSVSSKDIHLSKHAKVSGSIAPVTTMHKRHRQTDRQMDTDIVA